MNTYRTVDLARMFGVHVNTVRLYERYGLIPKAERTQSGYRIFTELHVEQFKLARAALRVEVLQNGLRKQAVTIIKTSASGDFETALKLTQHYRDQVEQEIKHAEEAVRICTRLLAGSKEPCTGHAQELGIKRPVFRQADGQRLPGLYGGGYAAADHHTLPPVRQLFPLVHSADAKRLIQKSVCRYPENH